LTKNSTDQIFYGTWHCLAFASCEIEMPAASVAAQISPIDEPLHGMGLEEWTFPVSRDSDTERDQRADRRLDDAKPLERGDRSVAQLHCFSLRIQPSIISMNADDQQILMKPSAPTVMQPAIMAMRVLMLATRYRGSER
jgi:hypothetical protein